MTTPESPVPQPAAIPSPLADWGTRALGFLVDYAPIIILEAITFGNLKDDESAASKQAAAGAARAYHALHVLNTRPSITYLAKVRREIEGTEG